MAKGDSVYYSYDSKNYRLFIVLSSDKKNVLLKATNTDEKNILTSLENRFFIKNINVSGFKSGDLVTAEVPDANNYKSLEKGTVLGVSNGYALVETNKGSIVIPSIKLKKRFN